MTGPPAAPAARRRWTAVVLVLVVGLLVGAAAVGSLPTAVSTVWSPFSAEPDRRLPPDHLPRARGHGVAEGLLPEGATALDGQYAAIANLDPALLDALRAATAEAADDGVVLQVNSGWRSADYQQRLLDEAVVEHGSESEAARWVATPQTSAHVAGEAVDVGPAAAAAWLADHGADHGLCRVYDNEPWHFELRPQAVTAGCPPTYADPTQDPRLRR
ncbi:M15 family metallopeptidase [Nocardioides sp. TF02-7]|uniref:M15 family metallopeptidase n=1 Tax=Nocardioides sp. TF02-7 TaxID=2917724 RepID=UPI001F06A590|nr:M15 family metallopeptidase [Nocardioides sp. TF02-7]UMG91882.1 M15 family metallopeptidase [Nocardioides sp. TF02-7]